MDEAPPDKCWLYHPDGRSQIFSGVAIEHAMEDGWARHSRRTGTVDEDPPAEAEQDKIAELNDDLAERTAELVETSNKLVAAEARIVELEGETTADAQHEAAAEPQTEG